MLNKLESVFAARVVLFALLALIGVPTVHAQTATSIQPKYLEVKTSDGVGIRYALVVPPGFDAAKEYRTLFALPPGDEDQAMVEEALKRYWQSEAANRGWVVVSPISPSGPAYFSKQPASAIAVLDDVASRIKIKGRKPLLAGISNGGLDAFAVLVYAPARFDSIVVLPGMLADGVTDEQLRALSGKAISMFVGEKDQTWLEGANRSMARFKAAGVSANLHVIRGEDHILPLNGSSLFDAFGEAQPAPPAKGADTTDAVEEARTRAVNSVLDDFHDAAAKADEPRYFAHFTPDAVFLGTDATERWTYAQFRAWAKPHFANGKGWKYTPRDRHVFFAPSGDCAWFDETVNNARLNDCRGTGVLVKLDGVWRIAQYHLVLPVPNDLADKLVEMGKALNKPTP